MFHIKTQQFEGPLNLLCELIESQKLDITRVSLANVADDYLKHIDNKDNIDIGSLSEFLTVASQLILLKSKALLPLFEFTTEEEEEIEDLEERLKEYKRFKQSSIKLSRMRQENKIAFSRDEENFVLKKFVPQNISKKELHSSFIKVLQEVPSHEELAQQVMEEVVSLEEKIVVLKDTIEKRMKIAFHETISEASDKVDLIVTFLAMLEMIKQKVVTVQQTEIFGEIMIKKN